MPTSFHSLPVLSPMGSPPHWVLEAQIAQNLSYDGSRGNWRKEHKQWKERAVIEEEGLLEDEERKRNT
ncbi:hypothetical protein JCGZ_22798 [Jatropha curcas]|uniref:Uncharacterized protein n=1 Tax=Jatropha curcas TaxID=180498 RepID=A0A067L475_JATCU|nr:hypothetical protein JCGZ_22798 [Jatropha curcas]